MSCEENFLKNKKRDWLEQVGLIKNVVQKFGNHVKEVCQNF